MDECSSDQWLTASLLKLVFVLENFPSSLSDGRRVPGGQPIIGDTGGVHDPAARPQRLDDRPVPGRRLPYPPRNPAAFEQDQGLDRLGTGE